MEMRPQAELETSNVLVCKEVIIGSAIYNPPDQSGSPDHPEG